MLGNQMLNLRIVTSVWNFGRTAAIGAAQTSGSVPLPLSSWMKMIAEFNEAEFRRVQRLALALQGRPASESENLWLINHVLRLSYSGCADKYDSECGPISSARQILS
jgi:hypothetical protein